MAENEKTLDELASSTARLWTRLRVGVDVDLPPVLLAQFARLLSKSAATLADALAEAPVDTHIEMNGHLDAASAQALAAAIGLPPDQIPDHWNLES